MMKFAFLFVLALMVHRNAVVVVVNAFHVWPLQHRTLSSSCTFLLERSTMRRSSSRNDNVDNGITNEWSVADDWNRLSVENPQNSAPASQDIFNQDIAQRAAFFMGNAGAATANKQQSSEEDVWMNDAIDQIQALEEEEEESLMDTDTNESSSPHFKKQRTNEGRGKLHTERFLDDMGREIALLVRCNESPRDMLVSQGRALHPMTEQERDDPRQLVKLVTSSSDDDETVEWQATPFLQQAVTTMFQQHCKPKDDLMVLNRAGIAAWMTKALKTTVGKHDLRVTTTVSKHGAYGKGYLTLQDFLDLYLQAVVGSKQPKNSSSNKKNPATMWRLLQSQQASSIQSVWRDIRNHGIRSPAEDNRAKLEREMEARLGTNDADKHSSSELDITVDHDADTLMDECEIIDETFTVSHTTDREGSSSHEAVKVVAPGSTTPVWMKDGDFVFIDEESCIGCMQCTSAAPASFRMVENGRARTYTQRKSPEVGIAVSTCPVDCMHYVSFDELKELETARDHGDGREDHRHFGHSKARGYVGRIPLYVSGIDSDANHRSSWYHYLKNKCFMSSECPKRGCYACPSYNEPGKNPYFQARLQEATHVRAEYFIQTGIADAFRKTADL